MTDRKLVRIPKPRIHFLRDEYAIVTGQFWCCTGGLFCARGRTPAGAFRAYQDHIQEMREMLRPKYFGPVRSG